MFTICKIRLEELTKIFLECQPNCEACDNLIYQLSQHIRATHVINETPGTFETTDYNEVHRNHNDQNSDENVPSTRSSTRLRVKKSIYYQEKYLSRPPKAEPQPVKKKIKVEILPFATDTLNSTPYSPDESNYNITQDDYSEQGLDMDDVDLEYKCDVNLNIEGEEEPVDSKVVLNPIVEEGLENPPPPIKPKPKRIRNRYRKGYPKLKLGLGRRSKGPHICSVCKIEFFKGFDLINHFQSEHKDATVQPYSCTMCEKTYPSSKHLCQHIRYQHSKKEKKPFPCELCEKKFDSRNKVVIHLRSHTGETPFVCCVCGKGFAKKHTYKFHMRIHLGIKPFKCDHCGKAFVKKDKLVVHVRTHTREKPYMCDTCGKSYAVQELLSIHKRNHTGERPFLCEQCSKCFTTRRGLNSHIKTHQSVKEFSCQQCGKAFTLKSQLHVHSKTHQLPAPGLCPESNVLGSSATAVSQINYNYEPTGTLTHSEENEDQVQHNVQFNPAAHSASVLDSVPISLMNNFGFGFL